MKKILNILSLLVLVAFVTGCSADDVDHPSKSGLPNLSEMKVNITVGEMNVVTFNLENTGCVPVWIFDENDVVAENGYTRTYLDDGTYTVQVRVYNHNGMSEGSITQEFVVKDNLAIYYLAGTGNKTWVMDAGTAGHIGCGESGSNGLGWWSAGPNEKAGSGMYDDMLTFGSDLSYNFNPGPDGMIYVNEGSGYKPEYNTGNGDYDAPADVINSTYKVERRGEFLYLVFPQNVHIGYIPNPEALADPSYKILTLSENEMELVVDNGDIAWHYRFIPKV